MAHYTPEQAEAMAAATTIDPIDEVATVRNDGMPEADPRFFLDYEWYDWFIATHPEWMLADEGMQDSADPDIVWTVQLERRPIE